MSSTRLGLGVLLFCLQFIHRFPRTGPWLRWWYGGNGGWKGVGFDGKRGVGFKSTEDVKGVWPPISARREDTTAAPSSKPSSKSETKNTNTDGAAGTTDTTGDSGPKKDTNRKGDVTTRVPAHQSGSNDKSIESPKSNIASSISTTTVKPSSPSDHASSSPPPPPTDPEKPEEIVDPSLFPSSEIRKQSLPLYRFRQSSENSKTEFIHPTSARIDRFDIVTAERKFRFHLLKNVCIRREWPAYGAPTHRISVVPFQDVIFDNTNDGGSSSSSENGIQALTQGRILNGTALKKTFIDNVGLDLMLYNTLQEQLSSTGLTTDDSSKPTSDEPPIPPEISLLMPKNKDSSLDWKSNPNAGLFFAASKDKDGKNEFELGSPGISPINLNFLGYEQEKEQLNPEQILNNFRNDIDILDPQYSGWSGGGWPLQGPENGYWKPKGGENDAESTGSLVLPGENLVQKEYEVPIVLFQSNYYGHWYHSFTDNIFPLFFTRLAMGWPKIRGLAMEQISSQISTLGAARTSHALYIWSLVQALRLLKLHRFYQ